MDMVVCVKQILDPETPSSAFKVDEATKKVIPPQGMSPVINPFDAQAVEAALRIRDATGSGKITVLSLGPASARDAVKHGLAMGADDGILIDDPALTDADSFVAAKVLAAAIRKVGAFDIVFCGRQAADWDMGVVGPGLGELLGVPAITITKSVQAVDGHLRVERVLMDGFETVDVPTPCVVTVSNEFGDPRYPQLRQIMMAARKQVAVWTAADLGLSDEDMRSPLRVERLYVPVKESHVEVIEGDTVEDQAANLARRLREAKII